MSGHVLENHFLSKIRREEGNQYTHFIEQYLVYVKLYEHDLHDTNFSSNGEFYERCVLHKLFVSINSILLYTLVLVNPNLMVK